MTRSLRVPLRGHDRRSVWRRGVLRKALAAALLAAAVYAMASVLAPAAPDPGPLVAVAAVDLSVGQEVTGDSVRTVRMSADLVPDGALSDRAQAHGAVTTAPMRAGEVFTDLRILPEGPLEGLDPELVLAHLPLTTPDLGGSVRPGVRVDVLATIDGAVLARDVLIVQRASSESTGYSSRSEGVSFLVAVTPAQAAALTAATGSDLSGQGVAVVIRR